MISRVKEGYYIHNFATGDNYERVVLPQKLVSIGLQTSHASEQWKQFHVELWSFITAICTTKIYYFTFEKRVQ